MRKCRLKNPPEPYFLLFSKRLHVYKLLLMPKLCSFHQTSAYCTTDPVKNIHFCSFKPVLKKDLLWPSYTVTFCSKPLVHFVYSSINSFNPSFSILTEM